jgi:hypothetical protein
MMTGRVIGMTPARRDASLGDLLAEADRVRPHPDFEGMWEAFCDGEILCLVTDDELWKPYLPVRRRMEDATRSLLAFERSSL